MAKIREIKGEGKLDGEFLVLDVQQKTAKNGSVYLALRIGDRSGEIPMKIWDVHPGSYGELTVGSIVRLDGATVRSFNGTLQVEADGKNSKVAQVLDQADVVYDNFLPAAVGDPAIYWKLLDDCRAGVKNSAFQAILAAFFGDPVFREEFSRTPAALKRHHVYLGGLLEHTAGVLTICQAVVNHYAMINRDLLLTGAMLHDIGKVRTYRVGKGFEGTDEGKLIGHLVLGTMMVREQISALRDKGEAVPVYEEETLLHMLVSHHGMLEWGSPVEPMLLEACVLHHADNLDAQVNKFEEVLRLHGDKGVPWSPFDRNLGRSVFLPRNEETDLPEAAED